MSNSIDLSIVVPMYNEELVLPLFLERLKPVLGALSVKHRLAYEVVCVDDGSRDRTAELLMTARLAWPELRIVRLVRNAGHQAALTAGFDSAKGAYVVTIDADLQDPPETITTMYDLALARELDVVYAVRADRRSDGRFKRGTSAIYYRVMRRVAGEQVPHNAGDFRLVSRRVVDAFGRLPEPGRVHRLVIPWFGFPSAQVPFVRERRAGGQSKYPLSKMLALAFDSLVAFSSAPLRIATFTGLLGFLIAMLALGWSLFGWLSGSTVPGWASILAATGIIGAIQLVCLGLLGEYVARIFSVLHARPTFIVGYDSAHESDVADHAFGEERMSMVSALSHG